LKKLALIAFMCFLALIGSVVVLAVCLLKGWTPWLALAPFALILGLPCLYLAVKAIFAALARRRFAKSVLRRDGEIQRPEAAGGFSILRQQWQHGLLTLRPAYFSGSTDPVKSLPWFLVLGPRESGNPAVMAESGLMNLIRTQGGDTAAAQGRLAGCDWHLFKGGVFLDVKGLLAESGHPGQPGQGAQFGQPGQLGPLGPAQRPGPGAAPPWAGAGAPTVPGAGGPTVPGAAGPSGPGTAVPTAPAGPAGPAPSPPGPGPQAAPASQVPGLTNAPHPAAAQPGAPSAEAADAEFAILLTLLEKIKKERPIEGVALTVPAAMMAPGREAELASLAAAMRARLDELARRTDQSAPIYLVLTGIGALPGLSEALLRLEEADLPTGVVLGGAPDPENRGPALVMTRVIDRLKEMFLGHLDRGPEYLAPSLSAPSELMALERPLAVLLSILGHFSAFLPPPSLQGVWFALRGSADQPAPAETRIPAPGPAPARSGQGPGLAKSLGELFGSTMPANRRLTRRLNLAGGRRQKAILAGLLIFYAAALAAALALLQDVRYNRLIQGVAAEAMRTAGEGEEGAPRLADAYRQDHVMDGIESIGSLRLRRPPWPTRADRYRTGLARGFRQSFEAENRQIVAGLGERTRTLADPAGPEFTTNLSQLMWLFGVYHDFLSGGDWRRRSQTIPILPSDYAGPGRDEWNLTYQMLLFEYLGRGPEGAAPIETLAEVKNHWGEALERMAGRNQLIDPDWLIAWAGTLPDAAPVSMAAFWRPYLTDSESAQLFPRQAGGSGSGAGSGFGAAPGAGSGAARGRQAGAAAPDRPWEAPKTNYDVPAAYTIDGRARILDAAELLRAAFGNWQGGALSGRIDDFLATYDQRYLESWHRFCRGFLAVARQIPDVPEAGLDTNPLLGYEAASPHARALEVLRRQLAPHLGSDTAAPWLRNIDLDAAVLAWSKFQADLSAKAGPIDKLGDYREAVAAIKLRMPELAHRVDLIQRVYEAKPFLDAFNSSESDIVGILQGQPDEAVKLASTHFGGATYGDASLSPFTLAAEALAGYSGLMYREGNHMAEDLTSELRTATLDQLERLLVAKVGGRLDELWLAEVAGPVQFLSGDDANKALFGPDGLVLKFLAARLAPFVEHQGTLGYAPRSWNGRPFPLTDDLLRLISVGSASFASEPALESYDVTISAVATVVDAQAAEKPERTSLTLKSSDSFQSMDMFNYPISKVFTWKPATGGDARLTITLPSLELYLSYTGPNAFPSLLSDLVKGDLVLTPADFPVHQQQLAALGITQIRVMIKADGALPVMRHLNLNFMPLPRSIMKAS
jgi:hypothetical protein